MSHTPATANGRNGIKVTDQWGDIALLTTTGDGLTINATSADGEQKVDVLLLPTDLDALLDTISEDALREALERR